MWEALLQLTLVLLAASITHYTASTLAPSSQLIRSPIWHIDQFTQHVQLYRLLASIAYIVVFCFVYHLRLYCHRIALSV